MRTLLYRMEEKSIDADRRSDDERKRTYRHNGVRQLTATV